MNLNLEAQKANFEDYLISYKSYNYIKKKAMEQEFNWGSLVTILSIAFFVVALSAWGLSMLYLGISS